MWRSNPSGNSGKKWRLKRLTGRKRRFAGLTAAQWGALAVGVFLLAAVAVPGLMLVLSPQANVPAFPGSFPASPRTDSEEQPQPPGSDQPPDPGPRPPAGESHSPGTAAQTPPVASRPPAAAFSEAPRAGDQSREAGQPAQQKPTAGPEPDDAHPAAGEVQGGASQKTSPRKGQLGWPVLGRVVTEYGFYYSEVHGDWRLHPGIDIAASAGDGVRAAWKGGVRRVSRDEEGWQVEVDHGGGVVTVYGHLGKVEVREGEGVKVGQPLGTVGAGGRAHFEVKVNGRSDPPLEWLSPTAKDQR